MVRCKNCMAEYPKDMKVCPKCGTVNETAGKKDYHLNIGTKLINRYTVGKAVSEDNISIKYIGFDEQFSEKVYIYEYYPKDLVFRNKDDDLIRFQTSLKTNLFEKSLNSFTDNINRLKKLSGIDGIEGITDCFIENNTCYAVCDYEEYVTLGYVINEYGLYELDDAVDIMNELLTALDYLHKKGVVLGNISPEHIGVTNEGRFMFIDCGVAAFINSTGINIFNPVYSPPEAAGDEPKLTAYSDVYSIAALYYFMVSGVKPYTVTERLRGKRLNTLRHLGIKISKSNENAILNALNLNIENRYTDAGGFLKALNRRNTKRISEDKRNKKFNNLIFVLLGAVGCLCIFTIITAFAIHGLRKGSDEVDKPITEFSTYMAETQTVATTEAVKAATEAMTEAATIEAATYAEAAAVDEGKTQKNKNNKKSNAEPAAANSEFAVQKPVAEAQATAAESGVTNDFTTSSSAVDGF